MADTMILDRRTKDLVKEYVPEGDVLDSIVCFFFYFRRSDKSKNVIGSCDFGDVRNRFIKST